MRIRKWIAPVVLYQVTSRLVTLLEFIYAAIQVCDVLILNVWSKLVKYSLFLFLKCPLASRFTSLRLSSFASHGSCNHWSSACFLRSTNFEHSHQTTVHVTSIQMKSLLDWSVYSSRHKWCSCVGLRAPCVPVAFRQLAKNCNQNWVLIHRGARAARIISYHHTNECWRSISIFTCHFQIRFCIHSFWGLSPVTIAVAVVTVEILNLKPNLITNFDT
jgi:hypothetical protein